MLEEFSRIRCKADFMPDFYTSHPNHRMSSGEKVGMGAAAIAFDSPALAGLALKEEQPMTSDADYIKGMINGKPFAGWVGLTHLKVGDEVELAAEWQDDHYQVYAIALPSERVISVCPRVNHGKYIQAKLKIKNTIWFITIMLVMAHIVHIFMIKGSFFENLMGGILDNTNGFYFITLSGVVFGGGVIGVMFYSIYLGYAKTTCLLAENIFNAFGWKNPKSISLESLTSKKEKELKHSGEWYSPDDKSKPLRPTSTWMGFMEYWYYY
nr:putative type VI secretion system effector [Erwinia sp. S63]